MVTGGILALFLVFALPNLICVPPSTLNEGLQNLIDCVNVLSQVVHDLECCRHKFLVLHFVKCISQPSRTNSVFGYCILAFASHALLPMARLT